MSECVICERPMADTAYADAHCASLAAQNLRALAVTTPEARAVAYGLTGRADGASSGKPGSRSPGNDDALDALSEVQNTLTTWARHISEERGVPWRYDDESDPIADATQWLDEHVEWLRHRPEVDEAFADFAQAASRLRFIVDGPSAKKYLGPCGGPIEVAGFDYPTTCEGDVYGRAGGDIGTCRACGATVDQGERRAWLDSLTRDRAYRASEIEDAHGVKAHTIRMWADRGLINVHGHDRLGRKVYLLGEVLDRAAEMARRKAENEAKRNREGAAA